MLHAPPAVEVAVQDHDTTLLPLLAALPLKQAVALAVQLTGAPRNALYERALALKDSGAASRLRLNAVRRASAGRPGARSYNAAQHPEDAAMISREPTIERLAIARALLLEPFGLTDATLSQALKTIAAHRIDDADLYFQYTRSEGWSLEEGIVKSRQLRHRPGRRRACGGGREDRVRVLRRHLRGGADGRRAHRAHDRCGRPEPHGEGRRPPPHRQERACSTRRPTRSPRSTARRRWRCSRRSRSSRARKDPRIKQVMAGLAGEYDVVLVARADGTLAADVRPLVRLSVTVIAEQTVDGEVRRESGNGGGGGRFGLGYFQDSVIEGYVARRGERGADEPGVAARCRPAR